jgi:hypothetical protein
MLLMTGGLTEPAAWMSVMADVVMESGSMSETAGLQDGLHSAQRLVTRSSRQTAPNTHQLKT